jgi:hypothetical protein
MSRRLIHPTQERRLAKRRKFLRLYFLCRKRFPEFLILFRLTLLKQEEYSVFVSGKFLRMCLEKFRKLSLGFNRRIEYISHNNKLLRRKESGLRKTVTHRSHTRSVRKIKLKKTRRTRVFFEEYFF